MLTGREVAIGSTAGCLAGLAGWYWANWRIGLVSYLASILLVGALFDRRRDLAPSDAERAMELAVAAFTGLYPEDRVDSVALRAVEPDRLVISVRYNRGMPLPRRYFSVSRSEPYQVVEEDTAEWWPHGLR